MTSANQQIIAAYEDAGLEPDIIAEQFGWEIEAVKAILMSGSKKFYDLVTGQNQTPNPALPAGDTQQKEKPLFDDYEVRRAKEAIAGLVTSSEDDHIRLMASKFVINEAKGRHDVKSLGGVQINISVINDRMKAAKEAQKKAIEVASQIVRNDNLQPA